MLTTVELLKDRVKVLSTWVGNTFFKVGTIYKTKTFIELNGKSANCSDHPERFLSLKWYEERKPEDLPMYVALKETGEICVMAGLKQATLDLYIPSTEAEFKQQQAVKQKKAVEVKE